MTVETAMKPGSMPRDASSVSLHAWAIAVIAAAALGGAWFFQLVLGIQPCPLCLEQRYAYYLAIPLAIIVAIAAARHAPRSLLYLGLAVLAVAALGNAVLGGYHASARLIVILVDAKSIVLGWRAGLIQCDADDVRLASPRSLL